MEEEYLVYKTPYESEISVCNNQIYRLKQTIKLNLPENLQVMAHEQIDKVISNRSILEEKLIPINLEYTKNISETKKLFPKYDWSFHLFPLVVSRMNFFNKKDEIFNDKQQYVIKKCIPYLLNKEVKPPYSINPLDLLSSIEYVKVLGFIPDLSRLFDENYLDELVSDAHRFYYRKICRHSISICKQIPNKGVLPHLFSIDDGSEIIDTCVTKTYCGSLLKFNNSKNFNLETLECFCTK